MTVADALRSLEARRVAVAAKIEQLDQERKDLRSEEKDLNKAATALRRITGAKNQTFYCGDCETPFSSRLALGVHRGKVHKKAAARRRG
jgi:hypothetical protein